VFENRVLRRIFGSKRDEVTGGWRKLYNEELHNLYTSPSIIRMIKSRRMRWAGHVEQMREKRPLGRPRRRWVGNIKMDQRVWNGMDWIDVAEDMNQRRALVNTVINFRG
jgi:PAS domain-containing protein